MTPRCEDCGVRLAPWVARKVERLWGVPLCERCIERRRQEIGPVWPFLMFCLAVLALYATAILR